MEDITGIKPPIYPFGYLYGVLKAQISCRYNYDPNKLSVDLISVEG
jgi:hypothetical protein